MSGLKAIIVDDEEAAREVLASLIQFHDEQIEIVASCEDLPKAIQEINRLKPDVVFLDVQMPEYVGYEISKFFDEINFEIVFVTAYDQYAIKAFELNAIDYLVKPIERSRLQETLERLHSRINEKATIEDYRDLLKGMKNKDEISKIIVNESGRRRVIQLSDIVAIQADGSYCKINLSNGEQFIVSKTVKHFEQILSESSRFFRSHRAWLINLDFVSHIRLTELDIVMKNNSRVKISRNKIAELESAL